MDAIHYHVRSEGQIVKKAVYIAIGINLDGKKDVKAVYAAVDESAALDALDTFAEHWDKKYPKISQSWWDNWAHLSTYFKYPRRFAG